LYALGNPKKIERRELASKERGNGEIQFAERDLALSKGTWGRETLTVEN